MIPKIIVQGGWVMVPILLGSVIALTLVLERAWYHLSIRGDIRSFSKEVFSALRSGQGQEAFEVCQKTRHPLARVFEAGLEHADEDSVEMERVMEREGNRQVASAEKNLSALVVVVGIEPLLGFLGTILGLIEAFMAWEKHSTAVTVGTLAAGIYQAMITTAAGLIVAIPYFVLYHIFLNKAAALAHEINHYGDELLGVVRKLKREAA